MYIQCKQLAVELGGKLIIKQIDADFEKQKFIGVIGPNGSGKSTLLRSIYRVLKPKTGAIYLDGKPLKDYGYKASARKMAVVSQHNYYNFEFNVKDVVLMGRSPHKKNMERDNAEDYRIVNEALAQVDMANYHDRSFSTLSGGEQQRIILARALAQKTDCLILDEPTNHLDIRHQLHILDLVKKMNITVIAALHDLNTALAYCDYLYVLKDGHIFAAGDPKEIITPQLIKDVYQVDSKIISDRETGRQMISYY